MPHLTRNDYSTVLDMLARLQAHAVERGAFVQATLGALADVVPYEQACVSVRVPAPVDAARPAHTAGFTADISLSSGNGRLVRIELRRTHRDFSGRDRERLALLQPHLDFLYRQACGSSGQPPGAPAATAALPGPSTRAREALTRRELDVMQWVACGKTDADIGVLLAISTRTVHKHLEHIYEKLGVETRTAAVMAMHRTTEPAAASPP